MRSVLLAGVGVLCFLLFFIDPATAPFYPACPFHSLTGLYCPGCGSLRATHSLLHGCISKAFSLNPLLVLFLALVGLSRLSDTFIPSLGRGFLFQGRFSGWFVLTIVVAFWILRNIPQYPLTLLAPN